MNSNAHKSFLVSAKPSSAAELSSHSSIKNGLRRGVFAGRSHRKFKVSHNVGITACLLLNGSHPRVKNPMGNARAARLYGCGSRASKISNKDGGRPFVRGGRPFLSNVSHAACAQARGNLQPHSRSITEEFFQLIAGRGFAWVCIASRCEDPAGNVEVLAEVAHVLVEDGVGSAVPALLGCTMVVADTIQADAQI